MSAHRCYTQSQVLDLLQLTRGAFYKAKRAGRLPMLEELKPRIGRPRYRADLVDRWIAGQFTGPRTFRKAG